MPRQDLDAEGPVVPCFTTITMSIHLPGLPEPSTRARGPSQQRLLCRSSGRRTPGMTVWAGLVPSGTAEESACLPPASGACPQPRAALGLERHHSDPCFMLTSPGCVSVSKLLLFVRTRVLSDLGPTVPQENLTLITSA